MKPASKAAALKAAASRIPGLLEATRPFRRWLRARLPAAYDAPARERMARTPKLARFARRVDAALRLPLPGAAARCTRAFEELVRGGFARDFIDTELARIVADPSSIASFTRAERGLTILRTHSFTLRLQFLAVPSGEAPVTSVGRSMLVTPVGRDAILLERYAVPSQRIDRYRRDDRARAVESRRLESGDTAALLRRRDAYRMVPPKRTVLLVLDFGPSETFTWQYDRTTLAPRRGIPADLAVTRIAETLRLIAVWGDASFLPLVEDVYRHPSHAVRWAALQTAWKIAPERALGLTARAARDEHPDLRAVARALTDAPDDARRLLVLGETQWP